MAAKKVEVRVNVRFGGHGSQGARQGLGVLSGYVAPRAGCDLIGGEADPHLVGPKGWLCMRVTHGLTQYPRFFISKKVATIKEIIQFAPLHLAIPLRARVCARGCVCYWATR